MIPFNLSVPSSKTDPPPIERSPNRGLQDMPDEVLLKIISFIFTFSHKDCAVHSRNKLEKAASSLNALAGVNQRLRQIAKDRYTLKVVTGDSLDAFGTLGRLNLSGAFSNVLNLDLEILEGGFRIYLENPNNKLYKIFSLAQKVKELALDLVREANALFKRADSIPSVEFTIIRNFEKAGFRPATGASDLSIGLHQVFIYTPCYLIMIKENEPEYRPGHFQETPPLPVLAVAEVLINHLQATPVPLSFSALSRSSFYEISKPNSSVFNIRKVTSRELIRLEDVKSFENAMEGQRFIVRDPKFTFYEISQIGSWWEGYVLDIANSLYKNKELPSYVAKMIEV